MSRRHTTGWRWCLRVCTPSGWCLQSSRTESHIFDTVYFHSDMKLYLWPDSSGWRGSVVAQTRASRECGSCRKCQQNMLRLRQKCLSPVPDRESIWLSRCCQKEFMFVISTSKFVQTQQGFPWNGYCFCLFRVVRVEFSYCNRILSSDKSGVYFKA